ncbi:site-specific integrase [bacterium AH-315-J21]|nr:site-specific integrase [bacterium AH-315-J21]
MPHKYMAILTRLSQEFNKPFDQVAQEDMERLILDLEEGRILSARGKPYSDETRADYKKAIKKFWKWKDGNNSQYPDLVEWIDVSVRIKEIPALSRKEIESLVDGTPSIRLKALIMILFDSGARIEELLNVRLKEEHVTWKPELDCYTIRLEFSKTKPRTVSLPLASKHLRAWLQVHSAKGNPESQLFPIQYDAIRTSLYRLATRVLQKRVTPHILRHSSTTYFANKLNHYQLCNRYGWTMSSDQVNRYIDRAGILEEQTTKLIRESETTSVVAENESLREELMLLKQQRSGSVRNSQSYSSSQGLLSILADMMRKHDAMAEIVEDLSRKRFDLVITKEIKQT